MEITLLDVYQDKNTHYSLLYQLLNERETDEAISHNEMPTWLEHETYLNKIPNKRWFIIYADSSDKYFSPIPVGSIYLSWKNEIGISIFKKYRRMGFGSKAIKELINIHKESFYIANINPANQKSIELFRDKLEFKHIQNTYRLENKDAVS